MFNSLYSHQYLNLSCESDAQPSLNGTSDEKRLEQNTGHSKSYEDTFDLSPNHYVQHKFFFSRILATMLFVVALPIIGMAIILIRVSSRGKGIFKQQRVGLNGKCFTLYKIRTMTVNAEKETGPIWSPREDHRITKVGKILRSSHIDELPQLWNVITGDMTLIGPRPERPVIAQKLSMQIPGYMNRFKIRPGITGLAQINLPPDESIFCVQRKLLLDRQYAEKSNINLDLRIYLCTLVRFLGIRSTTITKLLGVFVDPQILNNFFDRIEPDRSNSAKDNFTRPRINLPR